MSSNGCSIPHFVSSTITPVPLPSPTYAVTDAGWEPFPERSMEQSRPSVASEAGNGPEKRFPVMKSALRLTRSERSGTSPCSTFHLRLSMAVVGDLEACAPACTSIGSVCGMGAGGVADGATARTGTGCVGCTCGAAGVCSLLTGATDGTGVGSVGCGCDVMAAAGATQVTNVVLTRCSRSRWRRTGKQWGGIGNLTASEEVGLHKRNE
jgi:hypothetical protein